MKSVFRLSGRGSRVTGKGVLGPVLGLVLLIASGASWAGSPCVFPQTNDIEFSDPVAVDDASEPFLLIVSEICGASGLNLALSGDHPDDFVPMITDCPSPTFRGDTQNFCYNIVFSPTGVGTRLATLTLDAVGIGDSPVSISLQGEGIAGTGGCDGATVAIGNEVGTKIDYDFMNVDVLDSASVKITYDLDGNSTRGGGGGGPCLLTEVYFANCGPIRGELLNCPPFAATPNAPNTWEATFEPNDPGAANDTLVFVLQAAPVRGLIGEITELRVNLSGNGVNPDTDGDGILDDVDACPGTVIPELGVPTRRLGRNRWVLGDNGDTVFDTNAPPGFSEPFRSFTIEQTGGCSCEQILEAFDVNPNSGQYKFGCSTSTMQGWISVVEPPSTQCMSTGDFCGGIAGLPCFDEGQFCADDPNDNCDPAAGGADCPGVCVYGTPETCPTWTPLFDF